tara:strand:- start:1009 stop:1266 length:258 start_codon:yes stop_codon:yes gene_type:complete
MPAARKKYLNRRILYLVSRDTIIKNKKNLKNNNDFINLERYISLYSLKYKDLAKLKQVEKKSIKKNKKMIFVTKSNLSFINLDLK